MDAHEHNVATSLDRFVLAARQQPIAATCVTAEAVAAGLEHHRRRSQSRRTILLSAAMAVAATLLAVALLGPLLNSQVTNEHAEVDLDVAVEPELEPVLDRLDPLAPILAPAVRVRSTSAVEVRGPWAIALSEGLHEIEVAPGAGRLRIELPNRTLELVEGRASIELVDGEDAVRVHTGVAAWVDASGSRSQISVERISVTELDPTESSTAAPATSKASELARAAEQALAAGRRDEAIATYRELVRKYPRSSQARAGLLDLARLLRVDGLEDQARCAYGLYLERWPKSSVRPEVESQLARLGPGPGCHGLTPQ